MLRRDIVCFLSTLTQRKLERQVVMENTGGCGAQLQDPTVMSRPCQPIDRHQGQENVEDTVLFCGTSLPLASNRWVQSTFSSLCLLSSITSAINKLQQHRNKFLGMPRIKPQAAG